LFRLYCRLNFKGASDREMYSTPTPGEFTSVSYDTQPSFEPAENISIFLIETYEFFEKIFQITVRTQEEKSETAETTLIWQLRCSALIWVIAEHLKFTDVLVSKILRTQSKDVIWISFVRFWIS